MTTATGDFAINFVPLSNVSPYTNANLTYLDAHRFQISSNTLLPVAGNYPMARYNGAMTAGATIRSKIEVGNAATGGDQIVCAIIDTSYNGYAMRINGTTVALSLLTAGSLSGLNSGTASTAVSGTVFELERVHATNTLNCRCNGALIFSEVNADFTTGLSFALAMYPDNSNASTVLSFAGDGIAASSSITPSVGALAMAGLAASVALSGGHTRTPSVGSLALTGLQPIQELTVAAPITGSLSLTGNSATVLRGTVRQPSVGSLTLTGQQPTLSTPRTITPSLGSLTLSGLQASVTVGVANATLIPSVGSMTFNGQPVTLIQSSPLIRPAVGSLTLTGNSASLVNTGAGGGKYCRLSLQIGIGL